MGAKYSKGSWKFVKIFQSKQTNGNMTAQRTPANSLRCQPKPFLQDAPVHHGHLC